MNEAGISTRSFIDLHAGTPRLERAWTNDAPPVLIAGRGSSSPAALSALQREYALRGCLEGGWSAVPQALLPHGNGALLVLADPGGQPIPAGDTLREGMESFLSLAIGLTSAVAAMHAAGVIHRALSPTRFLVDDHGNAYLTGFGFAARTGHDGGTAADVGVDSIEWDDASIVYMAPELAARMNVPVDQRADLYSLGCIFYERLVGRPPFDAADTAARVHAHATHRPRRPGEIAEGVPEPVSQMVMRLLEKSPEHRYAGAADLLADLHRCHALYRLHGHIPSFAVDASAAMQSLRRTDRVFGRDHETAALLALYRQVATTGQCRVAWVAGHSGIGKSSLLRTAVARMQADGGTLVALGKSDAAREGVPYAALMPVLGSLLQFVLGRPEQEFAAWRDRIGAATAAVSRTLAAFLPALATILGTQPGAPEAPEASPALERERVLVAMARLIGCFATPARPLVMVLDDLQWADVGSLQVLERLLRDHTDAAILVLGAYRPTEIDAHHPLHLPGLADVATALRLDLGPLDEDALRHWMARVLHQDAGLLDGLAEVVGRKTGRNPFHIQQLIRMLADDGLLAYDEEAALWRWSIERIAAHRGADDMAGLLTHELGQLPADTQHALRILACLGDSASTALLAHAADMSKTQLRECLRAAVDAGSIQCDGDNLIFRHDRIREAVYAATPESGRPQLHLAIARRLLTLDRAARDVFALAMQCNLAFPAVVDQAEREQFAQLNLAAGREAKAATAHHSALGFFRAALRFLGDASSSNDGLAARMLCGEAEFMTGDLDTAEARLAALQGVAGDGIFGADLTRLRSALYTTLGRFDLALDVGLAFLAKAGIAMPAAPDEADIDREYAILRESIDQHGMTGLRDLPVAQDPLWRAISDIFADLIPPALYTNHNLVDMVLLRAINLAIAHGYSDASADVCVCMNQIFGVRYGDYASAKAFGELALHLVDERGLGRYRGRVYMTYGTLVVPWALPARTARDFIRRALDITIEAGDHTFAIYCSRNEATGMLFAGDFLDEVRATVARGLALARDANFQLVVDALLAQWQLLAQLQDGTPDPHEALAPMPAPGAPTTLVDFAYWVYRLQSALLSGDLPMALEARQRAEVCASFARSFAESGDLAFYGALALLASPARDADQRVALEQNLKQLEVWSEACPENFAGRLALVRAELARVEGRPLEAGEAYARAVSHARRHGFTQVEALAAERAGYFHDERGNDVPAQAYLRHARGAWQRWGASAKARQLQARYPAVFDTDEIGPAVSRLQELDVQAVLRISNALASDIVPARLVETLLRTALESAGAAQGALVLLRDGKWHVPAVAAVEDGNIVIEQEDRPLDGEVLPVSLVHAVARTQAGIVLGDARESAAFAQDIYMQRMRPRSVLCVPLMRYAKLVGVLYLENSLATQVFTPTKAAVLEVIASQAAFALENARLYEDLVEQNHKRAAAEEQLRAALGALDRASRLKAMGELVASIVHEVGQPIAAVDTSASAALRWLGRTPPEIGEARDMLAHISRSATRAKSIIQGLRARSQRAEPQFTSIDLGDALREAATLVAGQLSRLGVALETRGLEASIYVHGDRIQLQQVVINLLTNGAESMSDIESSQRYLLLACAVEAGGLVRVTVEDAGCGIDPAIADRLLEPLFTTKETGMGMGLAISQSIVAAHDGTLSLLPRAPGGTCALFTLARLTH